MAAALDTSDDRRLRLAALDALQDVPGDVRARVATALGTAVTKGTDAGGRPMFSANDAVWPDAVEGRLPEMPAALRDAWSRRGVDGAAQHRCAS